MLKKRISLYERGFLDKLVSENQRYIDIVNQFNEFFHRKLSLSTVHRLYHKNHGCNNKPGRKLKCSLPQVKTIIRTVERNNLRSWEHIRTILRQIHNINISRSTLKRICKKSEIIGRKRLKKPILSRKNAGKQLSFARRMIRKDLNYWKSVVFSDESTFTVKSNSFGHGELFVKCKKKDRILPQNVFKKYKYNFASVKYWVCMSYKGIGKLYRIDKRLDSKEYQKILNSSYKQSLITFNLNNPILLHDGETTHKSASTEEFLRKNKIITLDSFPPSSPDLNVVENLLAYWKSKVYKRAINTITELKTAIEEEWLEIPRSLCKELVFSMPRRLTEVINNNGWNTSY